MKRLIVLALLGASVVCFTGQEVCAQNLSPEEKKISEAIKEGIRKELFEWREVLGDPMMTVLAREFLARRAGPLAVEYLDRFLEGKGGEVEVDLAKLLRVDPGVRQKLEQAIIERGSRKSGSVGVPQNVYTEVGQDFRYALGSIILDWSIDESGQVHVSFRNKYQFHPELTRATQAVHQIMEHWKTAGKAKDFWMQGKTTMPLPTGQQARPTPTPVGTPTPRARFGYDNSITKHLAPPNVSMNLSQAVRPNGSGYANSLPKQPAPITTLPSATPQATAPSSNSSKSTPITTRGYGYDDTRTKPPVSAAKREGYDNRQPRLPAPGGVTIGGGIDRVTVQRAEAPAALFDAIRAGK